MVKQGAGNLIPPNSKLIFEVEIIEYQHHLIKWLKLMI